MRKLLLTGFSVCILGSLGSASPAKAQAVAEKPGPASSLDEIVVTAQRREENLQRAAVAVTALGGDLLQSEGVVAPQDLTKLIPALNIGSLSGGSIQVTVRGVGSFAGNPQTEAGVAVNYDGVYISRPQGTNGLFHDLERVELLKGPQGTLYGRNSTAGALNIITRKPAFDGYHVDAMAEVGNYSLLNGSLAVNAPLSDTVALRVAAHGVSREGYLTDGYNDEEGQGARAHLLMNPNDQWSVLLSGDYNKQTGKGAADVLVPFLNPADPYEGPSTGRLNAVLGAVGSFIGVPLPPIKNDGFLDNSSWGVSSEIVYRPGNLALTVLPAFRKTEVNDHHYGAGFPVSDTVRAEQTSLEARLASDTSNAVQWVVGGYYFDESTPYILAFDQGVARATNRLDELDTTSSSAFGQLTYSVSPKLRLTAGARYTREKKTQAGSVDSGLPAVPPAFYPFVCPPPATINLSTLSCLAPVTGDLTFDRTTWKVGAEVDLAAESLLYFSVGTGFKAGGFFNSLAPNTFEPEKLTAYTLGLKNRFFADTLQLNFEAFHWNYENKQVSHLAPVRPAGFNLVTDNAGEATLYGLEMEALWLATPDDQFSATVGYVHSRYDSFTYNQTTITGPPATGCAVIPIAGQPAVTVDCSGRPLSFSPEFVVNLGYQHTFRFASGAMLTGSVSTRLEDESWLGDEFLPGQRQESSTTTDASLTWTTPNEAWSLAAFVDNIEDDAVGAGSFVQPVLGAPLVVLRAPLTYGVRAAFHY